METIFSSASSSQKSAIKIIRVSGSETKKIPKIFSFKPWPAGGTTTSLSAETSGVVPVEGDVNMRKRKRGELNEEGKKRRKIKAQNFKRTVKETQKVSEARLSKFAKG